MSLPEHHGSTALKTGDFAYHRDKQSGYEMTSQWSDQREGQRRYRENQNPMR